MECQKVCKQGRDDIIVKVSLKSPIPTSFYITVANLCENDIGMRLCKLTVTIISSLPCCILFGIPSLHLFTFLMFFKSCNRYVSPENTTPVVMCTFTDFLLKLLCILYTSNLVNIN